MRPLHVNYLALGLLASALVMYSGCTNSAIPGPGASKPPPDGDPKLLQEEQQNLQKRNPIGQALSDDVINNVGDTSLQKLLREVRDNPAKLNEVQSDSGKSVLQSAVLKNSVEAIKALLAAGADPNIKASNGQTALHLAGNIGGRDNSKASLSTLLAAGADPNMQDNDGNTVLHKVAERTQDLVEVLINHPGINLNVKNHQNKTPLALAEERYTAPNAAIPKLLREQGATK
ncbi:MAG: ankyrin repeat domain-containing protein [Roseivirga sp.]